MIKKLIIALYLLLLPLLASADPVEINGIYYNLVSKAGIAEVTYGNWDPGRNPDGYDVDGKYSGIINIPASFTYEDVNYSVTSIRNDAFSYCSSLTLVNIPNSVTSIGDNAFNGCINLIVINIGKDVLKIGSMAFANIGSSAAARTRGESPLVVNCYAETVPDAEYDAFLYTPIEDATLLVNDNLVDEYRMTAPWCYFGKIMGFEEAAGINTISIDSANARIYDMQGNRLDNPQKGVNIIRMKDGKTKKIIVK